MSRPVASRSICEDCLRLLRSRPTLTGSKSIHVRRAGLAASSPSHGEKARTLSTGTASPQIQFAWQPNPSRPWSRQYPPQSYPRPRYYSTPAPNSTATPGPSSPPPSSQSTPRNSTTTTLANPRPSPDDPTQEMKLSVSPRAATRLAQLMRSESNPDLALRITVTSGGCHGFQYLMSLTTLPISVLSSSTDPAADPGNESKEEQSEAEGFEDTVFQSTDGTGAKLVLDEPSLQLLTGSTVDFTQELIGSQFKVVGNPAASSSCGCGTSFDIKA